jgi:hypothetical protein
MEASAIPGWSDFFVAAAGVAGALAGLLFVALSINLARILEMPAAIGRAGETLILLAGVLAIALIALVPAQSERHLGAILIVAAIPTWLLPLLMQIRATRRHHYQRPAHIAIRSALHQASMLPVVFGALGLCGLAPAGIGWVACGCIVSMLAAMFSGWVLLVEILR